MRQGNGNKFPPEQHLPLLMASASVIGAHPGTPILSWLQACRPVIPGIPRLAGVDPARYASGRYGDQVRYGDGILFLFGQAHALATPKGGRPYPLSTLYYLVVGHLDSRLR